MATTSTFHHQRSQHRHHHLCGRSHGGGDYPMPLPLPESEEEGQGEQKENNTKNTNNNNDNNNKRWQRCWLRWWWKVEVATNTCPLLVHYHFLLFHPFLFLLTLLMNVIYPCEICEIMCKSANICEYLRKATSRHIPQT